MMVSVRTLKVLGLLGFLLLAAPFYDACNGKGLTKKAEAPAEEAPIAEGIAAIQMNDTLASSEIETHNDAISAEEEPAFLAKAYFSITGWDITGLMFAAHLFNKPLEEKMAYITEKFTEGNYSEIAWIAVEFMFLLIAVNSLLIMAYSFFKRVVFVGKLAVFNIVLILVTIFCFVFFSKSFEEFQQFKWGYYAFTFTQILIFMISRKISRLVLSDN